MLRGGQVPNQDSAGRDSDKVATAHFTTNNSAGPEFPLLVQRDFLRLDTVETVSLAMSFDWPIDLGALI